MHVAELKYGETVLIMGAGGNLGTIGIQIAKNVIGAHVIAAAGSDERVRIGQKLGADHGINYATHNILDEVMRITGGKGVDVLYDNIANPAVLPLAFQAIGMDGRLVTAGAHAGPNVSINFSHLYHKRITIKGRPGHTPSDLPRRARSSRRSSACCRCRAPPRRTAWSRRMRARARSCSIRRWGDQRRQPRPLR
jgi:NADPH2:quinone reductase